GAHLCAVLSDGAILRGEDKIDTIHHELGDAFFRNRIQKVFLEPEVTATDEAVSAIECADHIFIGPGDPWSTLGGILLVKGVAEALRKKKDKITYIVNTVRNEEIPHGDARTLVGLIGDFIEKGFRFNLLLYDTTPIIPPSGGFSREDRDKGIVGKLPKSDLRFRNTRVVAESLSNGDGRHDPFKLAVVL